MLFSGSFSDRSDLPDLLEIDVDVEAVDFSEFDRYQLGRLDADENFSRKNEPKVDDVGKTRE